MQPSLSCRKAPGRTSFKSIWTNDLKEVFSDVARYYDRANNIAAMGLLNGLRKKFIAGIELHQGQKALDVCAGTNVIGIDILTRQPDLQMHAIDRSSAMQKVGQQRARQRGLNIDSTISDVHELPFPDNQFDIVTLQYASRHLRVVEVFEEIRRFSNRADISIIVICCGPPTRP